MHIAHKLTPTQRRQRRRQCRRQRQQSSDVAIAVDARDDDDGLNNNNFDIINNNITLMTNYKLINRARRAVRGDAFLSHDLALALAH